MFIWSIAEQVVASVVNFREFHIIQYSYIVLNNYQFGCQIVNRVFSQLMGKDFFRVRKNKSFRSSEKKLRWGSEAAKVVFL